MTTLNQIFALGMARTIKEIRPWDESGVVINLGAGKKHIIGAKSYDLPDWDADVDDIPEEDNSVDCIHAYHFLEHVANPIAMLQEFQRVLKVGGVANIVVPYYTSQMQATDLTHKARFCEETWRNTFQNEYYDSEFTNTWMLTVNVNVIMGIVERNLCLVTQLVKEVK